MIYNNRRQTDTLYMNHITSVPELNEDDNKIHISWVGEKLLFVMLFFGRECDSAEIKNKNKNLRSN